MSKQDKKENLKRNIQAINDKIKKLELQKELYQLSLDNLEKTNNKNTVEEQDS